MDNSLVFLNDDPLIAYYKKVITSEECHELIKLAQNKLEPAKVMGNSHLEISNVRKSDHAWFKHNSNELIHRICNRIAFIINYPLDYAEQLQIAKYQAEGKFDAHFDTFDNFTELGKRNILEKGQRIITALLYLNDVHSGGETSFPVLDVKVRPSKGSLLIFENCKKGTDERHLSSIHEGGLVKKGEKWIATLWFHKQKQY
ncbi:2OG-Fe(II) oxygenase [Bacillus anthracis]|nr:2OG-Fe(II) oxygenase [Bacillus anthracis]